MRIWFWLKNSRLFSLPMTLLSWLVIFLYSIDGDILNGFTALIGISCAHMATNLFDDYMDYKNLDNNCQQCKCAYIKEGKATINDVLKVVIIYFAIAGITGLFLFLRCGFPVIWMAVTGACISLFYAKLSKHGFSELAVGTAFGPLLFEGVYYVMKDSFSLNVFFLSLSVVMFTIGLMYTHTVLDFEGDLKAGKLTISCRLGNKKRAIDGIFFVYGLGFLFTIISSIMLKNYYMLSSFILLPLIFDLHKSLKSFECGGEVNEFYKRLLKARNLMVFYSLLISLSIFVNFF